MILDVAHNPAAALMLASNIQRELQKNSGIKQISVVIGVMADKDIGAIVTNLRPCVNSWYISELDSSRSMSVKDIATCMKVEDRVILANGRSFAECYNQACADLLKYQEVKKDCEGAVIVTGSFLSVAAVQELIEHKKIS